MSQATVTAPAIQGDGGFTLVEMMIAMIVLVVGLLGMASTMATTTRYQDLAAVHADMTALGDHKIEQLRVAATYMTPDTMQLVIGGSLTAPTALHVDTLVERGRTFIRLWEVQAGPGGSRQVTVRVRPQVDDARTPAQLDFNTLIQIMTPF
ncbi:MAG TPA: prepilin-type N-terminal cleavage/methylation domain-containing protein [Gemmatimonadales bacterium]|nr:prepilin-type N-terminal cleavage/methylation domain-containing protein [Gemmatimonadales bacterium]